MIQAFANSQVIWFISATVVFNDHACFAIFNVAAVDLAYELERLYQNTKR
jgi:hypothetical protein